MYVMGEGYYTAGVVKGVYINLSLASRYGSMLLYNVRVFYSLFDEFLCPLSFVLTSRHVRLLQVKGKSYFLSSDLKRIKELIKEAVGHPDVIKRHRTRRDRGVKTKTFQLSMSVIV